MAAVIVGSGWVLAAAPVEAGLFGGPPWSYMAEPIEGRVVDQSTGQPIEGVVVIAQWILAYGLEGGSVDQWVVIEAVTDAEGRYQVPGWGPKRRPWWRWLKGQDPQLLLFKPGYWFESLYNGAPGGVGYLNPIEAKVRKSYWNGRDIELWQFRVGEPIPKEQRSRYGNPYPDKAVLTEEEWADQLSIFQTELGWWAGSGRWEAWGQDDWVKVKHIIQAFNDECLRLPRQYRYKLSPLRLPPEDKLLVLGDRQSCP